MHSARAGLYHTLAEALSEPPGWMAQPGRAWPLFKFANQAGDSSVAVRRAAEALAQVKPETLEKRKARYAKLFAGPGAPGFWLYESMHRSGRLFGPETIAVEQLFQATGIETVAGELPDHASVELAYLAHLAERQVLEPGRARQWRALEKRFIEQHAGRWLPELGHALARSGDPVYAPIGALLAGWLADAARLSRFKPQSPSTIPAIQQESDCTLCGFCVQVCPTQALSIRETDEETHLLLSTPECIGCAKCERTCSFKALKLVPTKEFWGSSPTQILRHSLRVKCRTCGAPTVSRAELNFVIDQIGPQAWLESCHDCR